jgi:hypothetical protein
VNPFEFRSYYTPFTIDTTELAALVKRRITDHARRGLSTQSNGIEPHYVNTYARRTNVVWMDTVGSVPQAAAPRVVCSTCMGSKVLLHFAAADESCPDCPPEVKQGPSEWTLIRNDLLDNLLDDPVERRWVSFARLDETVTFKIAVFDGGAPYRTCVYRDGARVFVIEGECCPEMAIARLLCGLRDGTVRP